MKQKSTSYSFDSYIIFINNCYHINLQLSSNINATPWIKTELLTSVFTVLLGPKLTYLKKDGDFIYKTIYNYKFIKNIGKLITIINLKCPRAPTYLFFPHWFLLNLNSSIHQWTLPQMTLFPPIIMGQKMRPCVQDPRGACITYQLKQPRTERQAHI